MDHQLGHIEHQKITNLLPFIGAFAMLFVIIGLVFYNRPDYEYKLSTEEMHKEALKRNYLFNIPQITEAIYANDSIYRFIDLRSAPEYLEGHIEGAVNIPLHKILSDEYKDVFNQDSKINILYFNDQTGACSAWMILKQLGYKNNYVMANGYDFVKNNIIDSYKPLSSPALGEKPLFDYSAVLSGNKSASSASNNAPANVSTNLPVKKKKSSSGGGGC